MKKYGLLANIILSLYFTAFVVGGIYQALETALTKREAEILIMRYGLYRRAPMTQREVAKKLDISRSYVSRLEKKAIAQLKEYLSTR